MIRCLRAPLIRCFAVSLFRCSRVPFRPDIVLHAREHMLPCFAVPLIPGDLASLATKQKFPTPKAPRAFG